MSGYDFEDVGSFASSRDAEDWARRNGIDVRDLNFRNTGQGEAVELSIRRRSNPDRFDDTHDGRRRGFFG